VFSITGCPHCVKAKKNLKLRGIPYVEINLTLHPDRRPDMLALQDGFTVPQVFFNDKHIGGATETVALLEKWDKEEGNDDDGTYGAQKRYQSEILAVLDPTDPRLATPSASESQETPAWMVEPPRGDDDLLNIPPKGLLSVLEVASTLEKVLTTTTKLLRRGSAYRNVVSRSKILEALKTEFDSPNHTEILALLRERQLVHLMLTIKSEPHFRLQSNHTPNVLNSFRVWTDRVDPDHLAIVRRLTSLLNTVTSRHDSSSGATNLTEARKDIDYNKLLEATCELQKVDMGPMSVNVRTAFVINVYNLFIRIAQIQVGTGDSDYQRLYYFSEILINIGGQTFSFNELENGILRGNRIPPYHFNKPFAKKDPRLVLAMEKPDCRIHFGLNCGAASCPPVKEFTAEGLEEELRIVALAFCGGGDNVTILPKSGFGGGDKFKKGGEIRVTTIMNWYIEDFGGSTGNLPFFIMKFLTGDRKELLAKMLGVDVNSTEDENKHKTSSVKVKFLDYDWAPHGVSDVKTFHRTDLKSSYASTKALFG